MWPNPQAVDGAATGMWGLKPSAGGSRVLCCLLGPRDGVCPEQRVRSDACHPGFAAPLHGSPEHGTSAAFPQPSVTRFPVMVSRPRQESVLPLRELRSQTGSSRMSGALLCPVQVLRSVTEGLSVLGAQWPLRGKAVTREPKPPDG